MFDIENTLAEYGLTPERYEELLKDCSDKVHKVSDIDWSEIASKYGIEWNGDSLRKAQQPPLLGGAFVKEYYQWKNSKNITEDKTSYMDELKSVKDEIYKEKRKLYDQRREYNKLLIHEARAEHLNEELVSVANKMATTLPLIVPEEWKPVYLQKEALCCWSDWHYGMVTDNIWNTYNTEICKQRVRQLVYYTIEYLELNKIDTLSIVLLGDAAHGGCHVSCRVKSEEDVCDQIMHVSEIMAEAINEISKHVNHVTVYSCYGNHLRTIQNKNDSVDSDNMEKLIPWWLKQRLKDNVKVDIVESEYKEFTRIDILGHHICCVHGNLDNFKDLGVTVNTIFSRKFDETIDYTISGDKHHLEEFEQFGIESILIRSLCGTEDFANGKRLYGKPGQTLVIFNKRGRESTYHITLD